MNCNDAKELFSEYFDKVLDEERSLRLEFHFKECKLCSQEYEKYCLIFSSVKFLTKEREIDRNFTESIMHKIKREKESVVLDLTDTKEEKRKSIGRSYLSSYFVGGAIAASVLVVAGLTIGNHLNQNLDSKFTANPSAKVIQQEFKVDDKYVTRDNKALEAVKDTMKSNSLQKDKYYNQDVVPVKEKY